MYEVFRTKRVASSKFEVWFIDTKLQATLRYIQSGSSLNGEVRLLINRKVRNL